MDPVKIEKLQAMRRYRSLQYRFLLNLVQYCLSLVCFGLFLSCPLWLPRLFAAVRYFFFVSVPGMGTYLLCPKCFFLLGNAIVVFLVGESRLQQYSAAAGHVASTPVDIYDEYVERSKGGWRTSSRPGGGKEKDAEVQRPATDVDGFKEEVASVRIQEEEEEEEEEEGGDGWEEEEEEGGDDECLEMETTLVEEDDEELPDEELNRRIEDFIASVNKQRRLEQLAWSG